MNIYEIYLKHPITGEGGWGIEWVEAESRDEVKKFPYFDEIITVNDFPMNGHRDQIIRREVWIKLSTRSLEEPNDDTVLS